MSEQESAAAAAAHRVQAIVEAAEAAAREIEEGARADAAQRVARARDVTDSLVTQADALGQQMADIAEALRRLRASVEALAADPARAVSEANPPAVSDAGSSEPSSTVAPLSSETRNPEAAAEAAGDARRGADKGRASEGARLIALNMALSGTPREETARYLRENFDLENQDELLDEVYARAGG